MPSSSTRASAPAVLAALVGLVAVAWLVPGLGDYGLWSDVELPAMDRVRAALGAAMSDLERHPWLPELLRTKSYAQFEGEFGLRLPHALAAAALVAMSTGLARARGATLGVSLLAGAFALAFPAVAVAGRTTLGNPIGEVLATGAVLSGLIALRTDGTARALSWAVASASLLAVSIASAGLAIGGALPLAVLAAASSLGEPSRRSTRLTILLSLAAAVALGLAIRLSLDQGDGYIPVLGAAKDLDLIDKPENRRFASSLEDLGYILYPWGPVAIAGALLGRRDRLPALWMGLGVVLVSGWSLVYGGPQPLPITVPAALCCVALAEWMLDERTDRNARRAALAVVVLAMLVIRKDGESTPGRVSVPLHAFEGEHTFPADRVEAPERLKAIGGIALLALLGAALLTPPGGPLRRRDELLARLPERLRQGAPLGLLAAAALFGGHGYAHQLIPQICDFLSPRALLDHHRALVDQGHVIAQLGNHRVRDEGLAQYGPGDVISISSRRELAKYLAADEGRAAIIRDRDLPPLFQNHRQNDWPLYVLSDRHSHLRLVSNRLPEGAQNFDRIPEVLFDEPPPLAHPTLLRFENYIEIIGWEVTDPIVRGQEVEMQLAIRVLRALPGGTKLYARFLMDRTSRLNTDPHDLTDDVYPPNLWREGDFILHRFTFKAPLLEIQPGPHELVLGLRRGEKQNFDISIPEGKKGEHGVRVRDKKRNFARIGAVEVW